MKRRSDPQEGLADFNPIMQVGEDFAFEGSQQTFVLKATNTVPG